jgi:hypothetical protein
MSKQKMGEIHCHSPTVELNQQLVINGFENTNKMNEQGSPYTQLELVHQINDKHEKEIESQRREPVRKRILKSMNT